jgi:hypothetical protein
MLRKIYCRHNIEVKYNSQNKKYTLNIGNGYYPFNKEELKNLKDKNNIEMWAFMNENYKRLFSKINEEKIRIRFFRNVIYKSLKETNDL